MIPAYKARSGNRPLPHNHCLIGGIEKYGHPFDVAGKLAEMWVESTKVEKGSVEKRDALRVALHQKSYRLIEDLNAAVSYATKYTAKTSEVHLEDAGRAWWTIGKIPQAEPVKIEMTDVEDTWFRRLVRRSLKKGKKKTKRFKRFRSSIANQARDTFVYMDIDIQKRLITLAKQLAMNRD
jgi:hypothetical protein